MQDKNKGTEKASLEIHLKEEQINVHLDVPILALPSYLDETNPILKNTEVWTGIQLVAFKKLNLQTAVYS